MYYFGENGYIDGRISPIIKGGTNKSGYRLGIGESSIGSHDCGGGGGGYYGGRASNYYNAGGAGGSSYLNSKLYNHGYLPSGNVGDGWAQIGYGTWN